jgi:hypothetical protein
MAINVHFTGLRAQDQVITEEEKELLQGLNGWRDPVALYARDRRLRGTSAHGKALLTNAVMQSRFAKQLSRIGHTSRF